MTETKEIFGVELAKNENVQNTNDEEEDLKLWMLLKADKKKGRNVDAEKQRFKKCEVEVKGKRSFLQS